MKDVSSYKTGMVVPKPKHLKSFQDGRRDGSTSQTQLLQEGF